jgi:acylphosphatase
VLVRKHVWVSGRVQGVWFRHACAERARRLHVAGWVRNCPDGRVEAVFEGDGAAVAEMAAWCQHGPERARVTDVVETEEPPRGLADFRVDGGG